MIDHRGEPTLARGFLAVAAIQIVWGVLLIVDPRRLFVLVGALATAGSIVVWVFSRTKGISWFPGLDHVEALGWRDVVTQFFQLLALAGAAVLLLPASVHQPAGKTIERRSDRDLRGARRCSTLAVLYAATHAGGHAALTRRRRRRAVQARAATVEPGVGALERRLRDEVVGVAREDLLAARLGLLPPARRRCTPTARRRRRGSSPGRATPRRSHRAPRTRDASPSAGISSTGHVASAPRNGACPVRNATSPSSSVRTMTMSASPSYSTCSGETARPATSPMTLSYFLQRLGLGEHGLDAADVEERLLGHVVELAVAQRLEALDRLVDRHEDALAGR